MEKTRLKKTKHKHKIFAQDVKEQLYLYWESLSVYKVIE